MFCHKQTRHSPVPHEHALDDGQDDGADAEDSSDCSQLFVQWISSDPRRLVVVVTVTTDAGQLLRGHVLVDAAATVPGDRKLSVGGEHGERVRAVALATNQAVFLDRGPAAVARPRAGQFGAFGSAEKR